MEVASGPPFPAVRALLRERRAAAPQPADAAEAAEPKAERRGRHAERRKAQRRRRIGTERLAPSPVALRSDATGAAQRRAARRRPAEAQHAGPSARLARPADAAVSDGQREPRLETVRRAAQRAPLAAWPGARSADVRPVARRAAAGPERQAVAAGGQPGRAVPAADAAPRAGRERQAVPARAAGRAARLAAAAGAAVHADHPCLPRRGPVRPGIRPEQRPVRLAKGRGPAGRSRPATSVSCASLFPSFVSTCGYQAAYGLNPR